ncbi:hypothetical protein AVEN_186313-1 [Araneus ventricosus]|uniref:Uncharacterized protein n=1 Tax=Araneus ventricosus TaxID=182803 RepID=A0A4Y2NSI7_ARAVE|nr:hypothetical protein AVEN_35137-1 [Araneus ventricosus]GBN41917.1 hypothetical protein AVEN_84797-1 [Araneus ventricosus]GBN41963.1 hypothetical protein AVEN_182026-1 [Araneus ventricosus]GBN41964.1 hypothetical protein AVEN_186313-1 [Araneus ventricosus]
MSINGRKKVKCSILYLYLNQHYSKNWKTAVCFSDEFFAAVGLDADFFLAELYVKRKYGSVSLENLPERQPLPINWRLVRLLPQVLHRCPRSFKPTEDASLPFFHEFLTAL